MQSSKIKDMVLIAMFAAIIAICSWISIEVGLSAPITLQTFGVALTAGILGWKKGLASIFIYILMGAFGLPVFAQFTGGFARIAGPTGGFIYGFILTAFVTGLICEKFKTKNFFIKTIIDTTAVFIGCALVYVTGIPHLAFVAGLSLEKAAISMLPFIPFDIIKIIAAGLSINAVRQPLLKSNLLEGNR